MLNTQVAGRVSRAVALAAAAALVAGSAIAPASAAVREDPASEAKGSDKQSGSQPQAKRYCVVGVVTGSIRQRTCKTRDQWIKEDGFDPIAKPR